MGVEHIGKEARPLSVFKEDLPLTSMIILTINQLQYTQRCIESIFKHTQAPYELIIVDNGSTDGTIDYINNLKQPKAACVRLKIISNPTNNGFAKGCNQGLSESKGQHLLLLNNDVVVTPNWLSKLSQALCLPHVGFSGPMSNSVSGQQLVKHVGYNTRTLEGLGKFACAFAKQNAGQIIQKWRLVGFCMLIKRELIEKIGGLDEAFKVGNFEDDDFCLRAYLSGYKGAIAKDCFVHHYGSQSFAGNHIDINDRLNKNWDIFKHKWGIPSDAPYAAQYSVPTPPGGFDSTKHFIPLTTDHHQQQYSQKDNIPDRGMHVYSEKKPTPENNTKKEMNIKGVLPGGKTMQILDQVLETIKRHLSAEQREVSIWILERIIEENPKHGSANHELGMLYYEQEELSKAQSHLHRSVRFCPDNHAFIKDLGDFYHVVQKDNATALEMYEKAIELSPYDGNLLLTAAHLCTAEKLFEKANAYYQRVLEIEPDNQDAQSCFQKLKDKTIVDATSASIEMTYSKAQSQMQSGDRHGAMVTLKEIITSNPEHALAHNDYAVLAYEAGDKDTALHHYKKAVEINPQNLLFLKNLADYYWCEQGNGDAAMKLNVRVLSTDPSDIETLFSCAQICMALGKVDDARDFVNRVYQIEPSNEIAGQIKKQLDATIGSEPCTTDRNALYQQADMMARDGDLNGAVEVLTQLVSENRMDADAFNSLGVLHYELGQKEKAFSCYREAVQLRPEQNNFVKNLADFYLMEKGQLENAMKLYLSVLEKKPHDVDSLIATGVICVSMNKADDAHVFFERVVEIEPTNTTALQALQQMNDSPLNESSQGLEPNAFGLEGKINAAG